MKSAILAYNLLLTRVAHSNNWEFGATNEVKMQTMLIEMLPTVAACASLVVLFFAAALVLPNP